MSDITIQHLSKKQREQIRVMYFGNYEPSDIALKLDLEIDTVRFFIFGADDTGKDPTCLYQVKAKMSSTAIGVYLKDKITVLEKTSGLALNILNSALIDLQAAVKTGEATLSVSDMKQLASIVLDMDKMVRLESGLATDTIQHIGLSRAEAREILQSDPFAPKEINAEYTEVLPWLKDGNEKEN